VVDAQLLVELAELRTRRHGLLLHEEGGLQRGVPGGGAVTRGARMRRSVGVVFKKFSARGVNMLRRRRSSYLRPTRKEMP
jgi:hypothetical protein